VEVAGWPALEEVRHTEGGKEAKLTIIGGKRYVVILNLSGSDDIDLVHSVAHSIDLGGLAKLS